MINHSGSQLRLSGHHRTANVDGTGRADMLRRIRASGTWEAAIACGLVALAGALAWVFRPAIDPLGCASILLAPIAITGLLYGMRTAVTAAGLAYLLFALLVAEPVLPSNLRDVGRYLTPPVFVLTALIAGGVTRILRASRVTRARDRRRRTPFSKQPRSSTSRPMRTRSVRNWPIPLRR